MKFASQKDMDKKINDILEKKHAINSYGWADYDRLKYFRMREAENSNCQKGILVVDSYETYLYTFDDISKIDVSSLRRYRAFMSFTNDFYYINHKGLEIRKLRVETLIHMLIAIAA